MRIFPERPILRLFLINGIMGAVLGVVLASCFVAANIFGLKDTMAHSIGVFSGWLLLSYVFACSFAGLTMATAVMLHWDRRDDDDDQDGGLRSPANNQAFQAIPVRVRERR